MASETETTTAVAVADIIIIYSMYSGVTHDYLLLADQSDDILQLVWYGCQTIGIH